MKFAFQQGVAYAAGFNNPSIVSDSTLVQEVEKRGFQVEYFDDCSGLTFPVQGAGECGDEWDAVAVVRRVGPAETIDVPDRVKWIAPLSGQQLPSPPPNVPTVSVIQCADASARMCARQLHSAKVRWGIGAALGGIILGAVVSRANR
jgi:hypothetical protein